MHIVNLRKRRSEDDRVKVSEVDELDAINNVYLRGIESLYTWKTLVPERLHSVSYSDTLPNTLGDTLPNTLGDTLPDILGNTLPNTLGNTLPNTLGNTLPNTLGNTLADILVNTLANTI